MIATSDCARSRGELTLTADVVRASSSGRRSTAHHLRRLRPTRRCRDYIPYALGGLREHAAHILVVVNGALTEDGPRDARAGGR